MYKINYRRWLMRVNLTCVILLLAFLQIATAAKAQRISLSKKNATLTEVFKEIRKQSGYDFVYPKDLLKQAKTVSLTVRNLSLDDVLIKCFEGQPFTYKVESKTIVVSEKKPSLIEKLISYFSVIDVRGKVVDENGLSLPGATVKVKGTGIATVTNEDGEFFLKGVSEDAVIVIAYLGYKPLEVKASRDIGVIKLEQLSAELDEVRVSTGYWSTTKALSTGNISKVTAKEITGQPVTSPLLALQGRVAGLEITMGRNAAPGVAPKIRIRGNNSLRIGGKTATENGSDEGNYPLYVIDGVPVASIPIASPNIIYGSLSIGGLDPLSNINPESIESIEVLKDADATAIYGSRGANGVILITTKKNSRNIERADFNLSIYRGAGEISNSLDLMNTAQYLSMRYEALKNDGQEVSDFDHDLKYWDQNRYTDWQKELLNGTADITDIQTSFSSGNENTSIRVGGGYHKETLIFPGDFGFQNISGQLSVTHTSLDRKFQLSLTNNYGLNTNNSTPGGEILSSAITLAPNAPKLLNDDGSLNWELHDISGTTTSTWVNPLSFLEISENLTSHNIASSANVSYTILPDLSISASLGYNMLKSDQYMMRPISSLQPDFTGFFKPYGTVNEITNFRSSWIIEPKVNYTKKIGRHRFDGLIGTTWQSSSTKFKFQLASKYTSDALLNSLKGAGTILTVNDEAVDYKYASIYGRVGYNMDEKYIVNLTARRDGSSRFGPNYKFGNFGALGAAWIFSKESFVKKDLHWLSSGKFRASYGITGSDAVQDYRYYNLYEPTPVTYQGVTGFIPSALYNPDFSWEATRKLETTLELAFLNSRLGLEISWYRNRTSKQLVDYTLPAMTGFPSVVSNFDAIVQNKGWEAVVHGNILDSENLRWNASFNVSFPKNKLFRFDGIEDSPYKNIFKVGEPLSIRFLYVYTGLNSETGLYEFLDVNSDGRITSEDRTLSTPNDQKFYGGLNNTINYKAFELSFLFQYSNQIGNLYLTGPPPGFRNTNQPVDVLDRWFTKGDRTKVQRFSAGNGNMEAFATHNNYRQSNNNVANTSFIRLKTLSLRYSVPSNYANKIKLRRAQLYLQGQNLLTFTGYDGLDPETGSGFPPLRMFTAGIQIQL